MLELPRGIWRWLAQNSRDLGRIAEAAETIARELACIRAILEDDRKENKR